VRMMLKLYSKTENDVPKEEALKLMTHLDKRIEDKELENSLEQTHKFIKILAKMDYVEEKDVKWAFGVLQTNSIGLPTGRALYPIVSIMNHSCAPNMTALTIPGEAIAFKANRDLETNDEFTIRYVDWMESKLHMRRYLKKKWFFDCACHRCQSPSDLGTYISSPKCTQCKGEKIVPKSPLDHQSIWECESCSFQIDWEKLTKLEEVTKNLVKAMKAKKTSPAEIIAVLQKTLSTNHHLILKQKYDVVVEGEDTKNNVSLEEVVQYCKDLLPIICKLDGDLSLHKGKVALKLATSQLEIFGKQFKEKLISKQELMRQIKPYLLLQVDAKKLIY